MIQFFNVTKEYPRSGLALSDATFRLHKGEFAFLTGASGAGKSTILRLAYL
jgi:cell division transport system ATP-binding protein